MPTVFKIVFATMFGVCLFPLAALAAQDAAPPEVTAFSLTPDSVDTTSEDKTLTVTMTLTDNQEGVCISVDGCMRPDLLLRLKATSGTQTLDFNEFTRTSGDALNGTYTATATLERGSMNGTWTAEFLFLNDQVGNYVYLYTADLEDALGSGVSDVQNTASISDGTAPNATAFSLTPNSVDTTSENQTLTVTFTLTDDQAGICMSDAECRRGGPQFRLKAPSGTQTLDFNEFTRTSGNDKNGTYTGTATLPSGSVSGTWTAEFLYLNDQIGNHVYLYKADLETAFGSGVTDVENTTSTYDNTAPEITAFAITPTEMNTDGASQTLTATFSVTDATGFCLNDECGSLNNSRFTLRVIPLIGTQHVDFELQPRISGDATNGVYQATATIPRSAKEGVWIVEYIYLGDKIGNSAYRYYEDLNASLPDASGLIIANTTEATSVVIEREWTFSSATATVTFPVDTVVTKQDGGSFAFYQMVNQAWDIADLPEDGLLGDPVKTIRIGIPNLNLNFSQNVTVSLNVGTGYEEQTLQIQALAEDQESWAIETECTVLEGLCTFTVDHATFFTANMLPSHKILVSPRQGGGPQVTTWNASGDLQASFMAYDQAFRGGVTTLMGDLTGSGALKIITVPYSNGGPQVSVFNARGERITSFFPYAASYRGGLSAALANVDDDAGLELIVAPSTGGGPHVRVYDYANNQFTLKAQFFAYAPGLRTGISVQAGDTDGDGKDEIIATTNTGAAPHVRVFSGTGELEGQFFAFNIAYRGGVNATIADVNADGKADIVVTPKTMGGPQVRALRPDGSVVTSFFAYPSTWRLGLTTAVGDVDGDGNVEIVTAPQNGGPHIRVFSGTGELEDQFMAYAEGFRGGVDVLVGNVDGLGADDIVMSPRSQGGPHIRVFSHDGTPQAGFMALHPGFRGGVNITLSK